MSGARSQRCCGSRCVVWCGEERPGTAVRVVVRAGSCAERGCGLVWWLRGRWLEQSPSCVQCQELGGFISSSSQASDAIRERGSAGKHMARNS